MEQTALVNDRIAGGPQLRTNQTYRPRLISYRAVVYIGIFCVLVAIICDQIVKQIPTRLQEDQRPKAGYGLVLVDGSDLPANTLGIDIIFVHGLGSNPDTTWQAKKRSTDPYKSSDTQPDGNEYVNWVRDLLPDDLPPSSRNNTRLFFHNYDSWWKRDALSTRLWDLGNGLLEHVRMQIRQTEEERHRTLVFVSFSYGGLVVKQALVQARARKDTAHVADHIKAILFLGTPHRGSTFTKFGRPIAQLLRPLGSNPYLLAEIEYDSTSLLDLHRTFVASIDPDLRAVNFFEQRPTKLLQIWFWKWTEMLVREQSATYEGPGLRNIGLAVDHSGLNKFGSRDHSYRMISSMLVELTKSLIQPYPFMRDGSCKATIERVVGHPYYIPFPRNKDFVGRVTELKSITDQLIVKRECQRLAIVGLGGVGKTQLALEFAYTVKENHSDYSIFWLPALSLESYEQACTEIARKLNITNTPGTQEDMKMAVKRYLDEEKSGPWLLILDHADDASTLFGSQRNKGIAEYLPHNENGLVVFTTRTQEVGVALAGRDVIKLQALGHEEAVQLLDLRLFPEEHLGNDSAKTELLEELTRLPLAIIQAAAYLNKNGVSIAEYLRLMRSTEEDMISLLSREFHDPTRYKETKNAVATTWLVSFDRILKQDPIAADLLAFMGCIEPKAIPRSILPTIKPEEQVTHAIGTLHAYAMIVRNDEDMYELHQLIHVAIRVWLDHENLLMEKTKSAIRHVAELFPSDDWENQLLWQKYLTHALRLIKNEKSMEMKEKYKLCWLVGKCLQKDGRLRESIFFLEATFHWANENFPEGNPYQLVSQQTLGGAYIEDGQADKAISLLEPLVATKKKLFPEEDTSLLASQQMLAGAYRTAGQIERAVKLGEHVVTVAERIMPEDDPQRLSFEHSLAAMYQTDGQLGKASRLLERVVAVRNKVLAKDHPDLLESQHALSVVYFADGHVSKAIKLLEHVVAVRKKVLIDSHPHQLASLYALAVMYGRDGQQGKAAKSLEQIVAVQEEMLAEDHSDRLTSQHDLAVAYRADGQFTKAIGLLEHVVAIRGKVLAKDHPHRVASQHELLVAYRADGQVEKAVGLLRSNLITGQECFTLTMSDEKRQSVCFWKGR